MKNCHKAPGPTPDHPRPQNSEAKPPPSEPEPYRLKALQPPNVKRIYYKATKQSLMLRRRPWSSVTAPEEQGGILSLRPILGFYSARTRVRNLRLAAISVRSSRLLNLWAYSRYIAHQLSIGFGTGSSKPPFSSCTKDPWLERGIILIRYVSTACSHNATRKSRQAQNKSLQRSWSGKGRGRHVCFPSNTFATGGRVASCCWIFVFHCSTFFLRCRCPAAGKTKSHVPKQIVQSTRQNAQDHLFYKCAC